MSKKLIVIIAVVLVIVFGGITGYMVLSSRSNSSQNPSLPFVQEKTQVKEDLTYTDDSGFSFSYPKDVKISDETPNDDSYYTLLSLTKGTEKMTITIKDAKSDNKTYDSSSLVGAITLGGISAKQYSQGGKLLTVASDQGVSYIIEGPKDSGFWEDTQNIVANSFTFAGTTNQNSASGSQDNTTYEEEEVVE